MREFGVHSEVGKLRTVMVCRPGLAHQRLTPGNCHDLLFDDVLWVHEAQSDHYDYGIVRFIADRVASPFDEWAYERTTRLVAAAEVAVGLAILSMVYRNFKTIDIDLLSRLKN